MKLVLSLASSSWGGGYQTHSGSHYQTDEEGEWVLHYYIDIDLQWDGMTCSEREYYSTFMASDEFVEEMSEGIEDRMTSDGEVSSVTVTESCTSSAGNGGFTLSSSSTNSDVPFSSWDLTTYDFSDWFVLMFVLFTGCFLCFSCGFLSHRRRVLKALEEATYSSFGDRQDEVEMMPAEYPPKKTTLDLPTHRVGISMSGGDAIVTPPDGDIPVGVSLYNSKMGILREDAFS